MSTQKDIIGAMKQQTSGPSRRALIASGVATSTAAIRHDRSASTPALCQGPIDRSFAQRKSRIARESVETGDAE